MCILSRSSAVLFSVLKFFLFAFILCQFRRSVELCFLLFAKKMFCHVYMHPFALLFNFAFHLFWASFVMCQLTSRFSVSCLPGRGCVLFFSFFFFFFALCWLCPFTGWSIGAQNRKQITPDDDGHISFFQSLMRFCPESMHLSPPQCTSEVYTNQFLKCFCL